MTVCGNEDSIPFALEYSLGPNQTITSWPENSVNFCRQNIPLLDTTQLSEKKGEFCTQLTVS